MKIDIQGNPSFCHVHIDLEPGENFIAESGAMQSMSAELDMNAVTNGGLLSAIGKKIFGGESFFVNRFSNNVDDSKRVTISQDIPGEIVKYEMAEGDEISLQKGAYLGHTGEIKLSTCWGGFISWFTGEGLIKLKAKSIGSGILLFGAYGGIIQKEINGDIKVDDGHLVAYDPNMKLKLTLAGGLFSSFFGGEGFVTKVVGQGKIYIQTRSVKGLASWLNPKFR